MGIIAYHMRDGNSVYTRFDDSKQVRAELLLVQKYLRRIRKSAPLFLTAGPRFAVDWIDTFLRGVPDLISLWNRQEVAVFLTAWESLRRQMAEIERTAPALSNDWH